MAELFDKNKRILTAFLVGVQTARLPSMKAARTSSSLVGQMR